MASFLEMVWERIRGFLASYNLLTDTLDILLVALFMYFVIRLVRDSRAEQLVKGIAFLGILYLVAYLLKLTTVEYLLRAVFDSGLLVLVIIFQPEIRRALEQAGHSRNGLLRILGGLNGQDSTAMIDQWDKAIHATANAVEMLQKQKMGALIVMERSTRLGEIVRSGTLIEAEPSGELISNLFFNKAPLHDGAMIIRDGRVMAAACVLPLSESDRLSADLGTRHRAAVGMSEVSDAVVVVVSEETGAISVAVGGVLKRHLAAQTLERLLQNELCPAEPEKEENLVLKLRQKLQKLEKEGQKNDEK